LEQFGEKTHLTLVRTLLLEDLPMGYSKSTGETYILTCIGTCHGLAHHGRTNPEAAEWCAAPGEGVCPNPAIRLLYSLVDY